MKLKFTPKLLFLISLPIFALFAFFIFTKTTAKVSTAFSGCQSQDLSGVFDPNLKTAFIDGQTIKAPVYDLASDNKTKNPVLGVATPSERWIEVDLSEQKVRAWDGSKLFLETLASTGLPGTPTPTGEFRIWAKMRYVRMRGGVGTLAYDLPNVPFVMFYGNDSVANWKGYSLHGTYWHSDFGRVHSHGCVNLPTPIAGRLYDFVTPVLPNGKSSTYASSENPGTRIIVHD